MHVIVGRDDTEYAMGCVTSDRDCEFNAVDAAVIEMFLHEIAEELIVMS